MTALLDYVELDVPDYLMDPYAAKRFELMMEAADGLAAYRPGPWVSLRRTLSVEVGEPADLVEDLLDRAVSMEMHPFVQVHRAEDREQNWATYTVAAIVPNDGVSQMHLGALVDFAKMIAHHVTR